jgi:hypothetical protein
MGSPKSSYGLSWNIRNNNGENWWYSHIPMLFRLPSLRTLYSHVGCHGGNPQIWCLIYVGDYVILFFCFFVILCFFWGVIMVYPIFGPAQSFKSKAQWILGSKRQTHPALLSLHSRGKRLESSLDGRARDSAPRFGNHLPHVVSYLDKIWATHTHTSIHTHTWISLHIIYIYT